jgi:hypothetical protein
LGALLVLPRSIRGAHEAFEQFVAQRFGAGFAFHVLFARFFSRSEESQPVVSSQSHFGFSADSGSKIP